MLGGAGAAVANGLDSILPFLPSEVILPLAGVSASQGHMTLLAAIGWTTLGSMVGSTTMYYVGIWLGRHRARAMLVPDPAGQADDVDRAEAWFNRHGTKAVLFGRMLPFFRGIISIPAGVERMNYALFLLYTTIGSMVWNTLFVILGYLLGQNWYLVLQLRGPDHARSSSAFVLAAVGYFVVSRLFRGTNDPPGRRPKSPCHACRNACPAEQVPTASDCARCRPAAGPDRTRGRNTVPAPDPRRCHAASCTWSDVDTPRTATVTCGSAPAAPAWSATSRTAT